jgi:hypothetical protein
MDWSATDLYGTTPQAPAWGGAAAPTQAMGATSRYGGWRGLVDPANPLVWFGAILLVTVGAAGVAGSVRLGKASLRASVG